MSEVPITSKQLEKIAQTAYREGYHDGIDVAKLEFASHGYLRLGTNPGKKTGKYPNEENPEYSLES